MSMYVDVYCVLMMYITSSFSKMFDFFYSRHDRRKVYKRTERLVMKE